MLVSKQLDHSYTHLEEIDVGTNVLENSWVECI